MPKEKRGTPRFACKGAAGVQLAPGLAQLPGKIANLSANGCLIELQKPERLSRDMIAELTFTINSLPFRMWGRVRAIRSDTTIGFQFPLLSDRVRRRLASLLEQLIEDFITGDSPRNAGEHRRFPRIYCDGPAGIQIAAREASFPATIMDLSSRGCLMAFPARQSLAQDSFVELKFDVNHLPFRTQGQVKGIRSTTLAGFSFPLLSKTVQLQLDDLVEELLKNLIKRISK